MRICQTSWLRYTDPDARYCGVSGQPLVDLTLLFNEPIERVGAPDTWQHEMKLGQSDLSEVHLMRVDSGERRILKLLHRQHTDNDRLVERFIEEARIHRLLDHPHIPSISALGFSDAKRLFLLLEYLPGFSLNYWMRRKRRFSWQAALLITRRLCNVLSDVHERWQIVHRDLKPANILLYEKEARYDVGLIDFGLAYRPGAPAALASEDGQTLGTPEYMSPEQACARDVDPRSDIYSLGVLLYELLTGQLPFRGDAREIMVQHVNRKPRPPRDLERRYPIPSDLETICLKTLAKKPHQRFQSMRELDDALAHVCPDEPRRRWFSWPPFAP